jgi:hypothetical protein
MADETTPESEAERTEDDALTSNAGYAAVPEGFVFVPTATGDRETLRKLFAEVEDPDDIITRPGYGYVVPEAAAAAVGLKTAEPTTVIDLSTPDTTPAKDALDTQESPMTTAGEDDAASTTEGPLTLADDDPARHPDDEPADDTAATTAEAEGADETPAPAGKKGSAAAAAS